MTSEARRVLGALGSDVNALVDGISWFLSAFAVAGANIEGELELIRQGSLARWTPELLTPAEAGEAIRRSLIDSPTYKSHLRKRGYSDAVADVLQGLAPALIDANALAELRRRGAIEDDDYARKLSLLGYDGRDSQLLQALRFYIPSAQDVVSFANRDVYYPDVVATYGMDKDFPEAMIPDMERAGMDRETALKYWEAHWSLPPLTQAFEMLQRNAETGITAADVNRLMRSAGVEPYWRDKLLAISYSPFTRVDIRRMHKAGILDRAAVTRAYQDIGYNAARAEQLTQFTEKLNGQLGDDELKPFQAKFRTHAESLYVDGVIDDAELHQHLVELGYSEGEANAYAAEAQFVVHAGTRKVVREAIRRAYETGHIEPQEATDRLAADGYTPEQAARIMTPWHVVRELHDESAHVTAKRELTKSEVITAYIDDVLSAADARAHLLALKYSEDDATLEMALADARKTKATRTAAEHTQHALFIARRITRAVAAKGLAEAGIAPARSEALLTAWQQELDARVPTLNKSEIAHAVVNELLSPTAGYARLTQMGYAHADAAIIVALANKGVVIDG